MRTLFLLVSLCISCAGVAQTLRSDTLTPPAMLVDLDSLFALVEETHVDPFYHATPAAWKNAQDWAMYQCASPLTYAEFAEVVARVLRTLQDSHTYLHFGALIKSARKENPYTVDLTWGFDGEHVFVKEDPLGLIYPGIPVLEWNGVDMNLALETIRGYGIQEGESTTASEAINEALLGSLLTLAAPIRKQNTLLLQRGAQDLGIHYPGRDSRDRRHPKPEDKPTWELTLLDDLAVIHVRSFSAGSTPKYYRFLRQSFKEIEAKGIPNVALDIRGNTGGSSGRMESLLRYVAKDSITVPRQIAFRQSPQSLSLLMRKYGPVRKRLLRFLAKRDQAVANYVHMAELPLGARDTLTYDPRAPYEKHHFDGTCYLLMDGLSGSASVSMASVFRQEKRGLIIGEPCLGPMNGTWGNPAVVNLPETELSMIISTLRFDALGNFDKDPLPIQPDIYLRPSRQDYRQERDPVLEYVKQAVGIQE